MKGMELPFTGQPDATRDFTFVHDIVDGFLRSGYFKEAIGQSMNLAAGREIKILDTSLTQFRARAAAGDASRWRLRAPTPRAVVVPGHHLMVRNNRPNPAVNASTVGMWVANVYDAGADGILAFIHMEFRVNPTVRLC